MENCEETSMFLSREAAGPVVPAEICFSSTESACCERLNLAAVRLKCTELCNAR